ncbi:MAG: rRNA maturation RNase YbeY [Chloroflexi bacterium]|nr:rRNA maturation RNase YbeY [Chloroflexota bacterium]
MKPIVNQVIAEPFQPLLHNFPFEPVVQAVLAQQGINKQVELSVVIDDDDYLRQLNFDFRGIDASTDVLSFPSSELDPDSNAEYIGDIIISFPTALRQAENSGHPVNNEITLLITHGVLHLLGHDHATPDEKDRMWKAQSEILKSLSCELGRVPGEEEHLG